MFVENTLLKTACHFLLLLVGIDTLTYRKDYNRFPILVGHEDSFLAPLLRSEAPPMMHMASVAFWNLCSLMTDKYRGYIVVLSMSKSVEPNEETKEMISGFQQGILCKN